jgi:acetylornithine deacetylase/succinyl-diaminopimelate desuccinylase-like protein
MRIAGDRRPRAHAFLGVKMTDRYNLRLLVIAATLGVTACGGGSDAPVAAPAPAPGSSTLLAIPPEVVAAAARIDGDAQIKALLLDQGTDAAAKSRWNQFLELVKIASPSRAELRMAGEIHRRLVSEWGFSADEVKTRAGGFMAGTDVNVVDGLPVYNACVEIKGSYPGTEGARSYRGQFPKVLVEGHIDVVNPEVLPPENDPFNPIRLQPFGQAVVETPGQLAALNEVLSFDSRGRIVEDANYRRASQVFANADAAAANGGVRIYVPGYGDMMSSTSNAFVLAAAMKKFKIRPVYDVWICGTAGEEGKGNLAGMKQLFGFEQDLGTGSNPLNFVSSMGLEGSGTVNFLGSYRFEMKFKAPAAAGAASPGAPEAMAAAIARIADVKTPSELRSDAPRTTYTVGRASCEAPAAGSAVVPSCSLEVDMRSPVTETLNEIRASIVPQFQAGLTDENGRYARDNASPQAVSMEQVWYGLRPAFVLTQQNTAAIHAGIQSGLTTGTDTRTTVNTTAGSLNDNVPANTGVPTYNFTLASNAAGAGGHAFWEWGTRGLPAAEVQRMRRVLTATLIQSGYHAADGTVIPPSVGPIGNRTRDVR